MAEILELFVRSLQTIGCMTGAGGYFLVTHLSSSTYTCDVIMLACVSMPVKHACLLA